jgi:hypothetical protein
MGANETTPADAARGPAATKRASAVTVQWATAAVRLAPTRAGGYEDTPVGRLPTGPAADAALAAAAGRRPRAAARRRALALGAAALGAAAAAVIARTRRLRRRRRIARLIR